MRSVRSLRVVYGLGPGRRTRLCCQRRPRRRAFGSNEPRRAGRGQCRQPDVDGLRRRASPSPISSKRRRPRIGQRRDRHPRYLAIVFSSRGAGWHLLRAGARDWRRWRKPAVNEVTLVVGSNPGCAAPPNTPINLVSNVSGSVVTLSWALGRLSSLELPGPGRVGPRPQQRRGRQQRLVAGADGFRAAREYYVRVIAQNAFGASSAFNQVVVQIAGAGGTPSPLCNVLTAALSSAPFGDPTRPSQRRGFPRRRRAQCS